MRPPAPAVAPSPVTLALGIARVDGAGAAALEPGDVTLELPLDGFYSRLLQQELEALVTPGPGGDGSLFVEVACGWAQYAEAASAEPSSRRIALVAQGAGASAATAAGCPRVLASCLLYTSPSPRD